MKNNLVSIFAAGVLAWVAWQTLGKQSVAGPIAPRSSSSSGGGIWPRLINVGNTAGTEAAGWQYFDNGTAIAPNGDYYFQGQKVWSAQP